MIELLALNAAVAKRDLGAFQRNGLLDDKLWVEQRGALQFIRKHMADHGEMPNTESIVAACPDFEYVEVHESIDTICSKLKERNLKLSQRELMEKAAEKFNEVDGYKLFEMLSDGMEKVRQQVMQSASQGVSNWAKDHAEREAEYEHRKSRDMDRRVPLLFDTITKAMGGLAYGSYVNICAWTGKGKSWLAAQQALESNRAGFKVLLLSGEMYEDEYEARLDTLDGGFNNYGLWTGTLDPVAEDKYKEYLRRQGAMNRPDLIIRTPEHWPNGLTLEQIRAEIRRFQPDLVIIDQFNLCNFGGSAGREDKERFSRGLKQLFVAERVVGIVITQANGDYGKRQNNAEDDDDSARELKPPRRSDYSDTIAVSQDCNYFLGLDAIVWPDPATGKNRGKALVALDKSRSGGEGTKVELHWLPGDGVIAPRERTDMF